MSLREKHFYEFGTFRLDPAERRLLRDGQPVPLTPKAFDTLRLLVENSGHLVDKDELLKQVWPDAFVEEATVAQNIFSLRKALGENALGSPYIETVPKRGYRFTAEVRELTAGSASFPEAGPAAPAAEARPAPEEAKASGAGAAPTESRRGTRAASWLAALLGFGAVALLLALWNRDSSKSTSSTAVVRSLAVLPMQNLSADPEQEYFVDGMTDALITELAQIKGLRVISRTSVMQYKGKKKPVPQIGRELRVDAVVEGTVVPSGERVRITAQLIHAATDQHLWAQSYERDLRDILALQREMAGAITQQVHLKLTPPGQPHLARARPVDREAHEAYLKGRYLWNERTGEGFKKAIGYFQRAIEKDASYALAYAGLADRYQSLANFGHLSPKEAIPRAKAAAMKALQLDETLAEAHASLGKIRLEYDWDWLAAEREFRRAIELNPNHANAHHWYAIHLAALGRLQEAAAEVQRAQELDPLSQPYRSAYVFYLARRYDQAIEECRSMLDLDPNDTAAQYVLGRAYVGKGMYKEAIAEFQRAIRLSAGRPGAIAALGYAYAVSGKPDGAQKALANLEQLRKRMFVQPFYMALVYVGLARRIGPSNGWIEPVRNATAGSFFSKWTQNSTACAPTRATPPCCAVSASPSETPC